MSASSVLSIGSAASLLSVGSFASMLLLAGLVGAYHLGRTGRQRQACDAPWSEQRVGPRIVFVE